MNLVISKSILGSDSNLVCGQGVSSFRWSKEVPRDSWVYSDISLPRDLGTVLRAKNISVCDIFSESHIRSWDLLRKNGIKDVPAHLSLPSDVFKNRLSKLLDQLWLFLRENLDGYYMNEFLEERELLMSLRRPKVDRLIYDNEIKLNTGVTVDSLERFQPDDAGYSEKTKYSQTGSVTGRLTASGPNILTLKKSHRKIFTSRFTGGKVLQIDLVSLEPRVALLILNKSPPGDIYDHVSDRIFKKKINRETAKIVTLCCLYGASAHSIAPKVGGLQKAKDCLMQIERFFQIRQMDQMLRTEVSRSGFFKNYYGRELLDSESRVNHFIQSSSVDVALLGFSRLMKECKELGLNVIPLFVIHDALIVDIDSKSISKFKEVASSGLRVPKIGPRLPVKIKNTHS